MIEWNYCPFVWYALFPTFLEVFLINTEHVQPCLRYFLYCFSLVRFPSLFRVSIILLVQIEIGCGQSHSGGERGVSRYVSGGEASGSGRIRLRVITQ